ncbi:MAG TPA: PAS domain S-box protein [Pseudorhodoplanes sp.]|nr:PAS domain S-box protein [Pseudorhodoplanes sp.]
MANPHEKPQAFSRELCDSERRFRLLVEGVTDYAIYMLDQNGYVTNWNAGAERIKGYRADEIIGKHFSVFYTPEERAAGLPERALGLALKEGKYEAEGWRVRKDGSFFWATAVLDSIRDDDGNLVGFAKITRDITERHNTQLELERVQKQLAQAQKMDALGQLTGGVAHDFNNLLMVVSGNMQRLKRLVSDDPKGARAAQAIETAAERGASLTRQLLTFSRRQRVNPQSVSLLERIQSIRDVLTSGIGTHIGLDIDVSPQTFPVIVDVAELEVALVNLVLNARDAMPEGGTIAIRAANTTLDPDDTVAGGEYVALTVTDTGVGIPPDVLEKVFEPFFTTKPSGRGTGLGLSQVHGFAHQAGGTVRIESTLGVGTAVSIYLPRATPPAIASRAENGEARLQAGTVLLVEDNPHVADASADLLEQLGYAVQWVADAESALRAIEADRFDLVLSDIVMPGRLDGLGLARLIRQRHPVLPVLLATAYSDAAHRVPNDFPILRKPYQMHELSQAIAKAARG